MYNEHTKRGEKPWDAYFAYGVNPFNYTGCSGLLLFNKPIF